MRWLDEQPEADELLKPFPADLMVMWPVSQRVSNVGNDDADLVQPVPAMEEPRGDLLCGKPLVRRPSFHTKIFS